MSTISTPTSDVTIEEFMLDELQIDDTYQRPLNTAWVQRHANNFEPLLIGTLIANERDDGRVYLIDGQQRKGLLIEVGYDRVHVALMRGLTVAEEAALFHRLNRDRMKVKPWYDFRARLIAKEKLALNVNKIITGCGYSFGPGTDDNKMIGAVRATEMAYRLTTDAMTVEGQALDQALRALSESDWDGRKYSLDGNIIRGLARFFAIYGPEAAPKRLIQAMNDLSPSEVRQMATRIRFGAHTHSAGYEVAQVLMEAYNEAAPAGKLSPKKLAMRVKLVTPGE